MRAPRIFDAPPSRATSAHSPSCATSFAAQRASQYRAGQRAHRWRAAAAKQSAHASSAALSCTAAATGSHTKTVSPASMSRAARSMRPFFPSGSSETYSSPGSRSRPAIWSAPRRNASVSVFVFLLHLTAVAVSSGASAKGRSWVNANAPATTSTARPARTSTDTEAALVTPGRETRKTYAPSSEKDACGKGARQRRIERPKWSAAWIRRCGVVRAQRASESVRE